MEFTQVRRSNWGNFEKQKPKAKASKDHPTHEFSSPWDDSDLVLIVENQKLHVHSFMLKMASPVFKAMLSGDFKEKNARELVLPGKKADQFVDFLRQMYPQFDFPINFENVQHIYALADEYQTKTVIALCLKTLQLVKVTRDNVSRIIYLAQRMGCNEVRQKCYQLLLTQMPIDKLTTSSKEFMAMDKESVHQVLVLKAKRLEKCLREIQPQLSKTSTCSYHGRSSIDEQLGSKCCVRALEDMGLNTRVLQEMVDVLRVESDLYSWR